MSTVEDTFAFIIHPIDPKKDVARKYPLLGHLLTERQINYFSRFFPPVYISEITGVRSESTGKELRGWFIACPFTPKTMLSLPVETVYRKIVACGHKADQLGARLLGLGAYTSVVGDAGETIARRLDMPVTNGDAYTVYMAIEAVREAARRMDMTMNSASAAVVGATGVIGRVCAQILAREVPELTLIGRRKEASRSRPRSVYGFGRAGESQPGHARYLRRRSDPDRDQRDRLGDRAGAP